MIHAGSDGRVIFKGEPNQIAQDYCNIMEALSKSRYSLIIQDEMIKRLKLKLNNMYGSSIDVSE